MAKEGVTVAEWAVLGELYGREATVPNRLAVDLGLTAGAISKLSDRLIDKHLVVRRENPSDGRTHTLALTPRAQQLVPILAAIADRHDAEAFGHLSPEQRSMFASVLTQSVRGALPRAAEAQE